MISFKAQALATIGKIVVLSGAGTLIPYPPQAGQSISPGDIVLVTISEGGPLAATFTPIQQGDTSRILLLEDGDFRIAFVVSVNDSLNSTAASISIETIAQEYGEGFDGDQLAIAALKKDQQIQAASIPPMVVDLPFKISE